MGRVAVKKQYTNKGLGKQLVERALNFAIEQMEVTHIKIESQSYLIKFYQSFGFKQVSEEFLEEGVRHVEMLLEKINIVRVT